MRFLLFFILSLVSLVSEASKLDSLPSDTLIAWSESMMTAPKPRADSAMLCLSIVVRRYYNHPEDKTQHKSAVRALRELANLHLTRFYDYGKAYEYLATALSLVEEEPDSLNEELPGLCLSMTALWYSNEQLLDKTSKKPDFWLKKAWATAQKRNQEYCLVKLAMNMAVFSRGTRQHAYDKELGWFRTHRFSQSSPYLGYARAYVEGTLALNGQKWKDAERWFALAHEKAVGGIPFRERCLINAAIGMADAREGCGNHRGAIRILRQSVDFSQEAGSGDMTLFLYERLSRAYLASGMKDSAQLYDYRYLRGKEDLKAGANVKDMEQQGLITQINNANDHVRDLSLARRKHQAQLVWLGAFCLLLAGGATMLIWRYRTQRRTARNLYEQNQFLLATMEQLKQKRSKEHEAPKIKYEYSALDTNTSLAIYEQLLHVLDTTDEIYKLGFSLDRLAELAGTRRNYASQVINEHHTGGFAQLLSDYRMREACRRLANKEQYGNLTIEGIAQSVGIMSRSTFSRTFKAATGLNPTDYRRAAE